MTRQRRVGAAAAVAGLGLLWGGGALAEVTGFYFGLGGGIAMMDLPAKGELDDLVTSAFGAPFSSSLDDSSEAWGLQVGYRWNRYVAAEVGYVDFGQQDYIADFTGTPERYSRRFLSTGPTLSVIGMLPLDERFDLHGRAGLFFSDTRVRERLEDVQLGDFLSFEAKGTDKDFLIGVGGAWNISDSYTLRVEYTRFLDVGDEDQMDEFDIDLLNVSILFR